MGSSDNGKRGFTDRRDNSFEDIFCKEKQRTRSWLKKGCEKKGGLEIKQVCLWVI